MAARKIIPSKTFLKSYKKFTGNNFRLKGNIEQSILTLEENAFESSLKTHKLSGNYRDSLHVPADMIAALFFQSKKIRRAVKKLFC